MLSKTERNGTNEWGGGSIAQKLNVCVGAQPSSPARDSFLKPAPAEFLTITAHSRNVCVSLRIHSNIVYHFCTINMRDIKIKSEDYTEV